MNNSSRFTQSFQMLGRIASFLFEFLGFHKMLGYESVGSKHPRSVLEPVNKLEDEWRNVNCECSVNVSDVDFA